MSAILISGSFKPVLQAISFTINVSMQKYYYIGNNLNLKEITILEIFSSYYLSNIILEFL